MVQDVEAGRATEVDLFAGTVLEIAERHGIDVPVNRTLYRIIRAGEGR
jgi:2-dehydropantoate 2-reductase